MTKLTNDQLNVVFEIYNYGVNNAYSQSHIQIALDVAFIESSLGLMLFNSKTTASGLYQYTNKPWSKYHNALGKKDDIGNQISAFYKDLSLYYQWFYEPETNGNIQKDLGFDEYVYIKHHDGRSYTNFGNSPGLRIYRNKIDNDRPTEVILD